MRGGGAGGLRGPGVSGVGPGVLGGGPGKSPEVLGGKTAKTHVS